MSWLSKLFTHSQAKTGPLTKIVPPAPPPPAPAPVAAKPPTGNIAADVRVGGAQAAQTATAVKLATVDLGPAVKDAITQLVPGAKFKGNWTPAQMQGLMDAVAAMPKALQGNLYGVTFEMATGDPIPKGDLAYTKNDTQTVAIRPEAFTGKFQGKATPPVAEVLMHEFAHLVNGTPDHVQDFAKLSGWKESVIKETHGVFSNTKETLVTEDANGVGLKGEWAEGNVTEYDKDIKDIHDPSIDKMMGGGLGKALYNIADGITGLFGVHLETLKVKLEYSHAGLDNFVGDKQLAQTNPREDYAEAFRTFVFHPDDLMKASPEKFLAINQEAKTYNNEQVQALATKNGVDLSKALTQALVDKRLYQSQADAITQTQGVAMNKDMITAADQKAVAGGKMTPLEKAFTTANQKIQGGDAHFADAFVDSAEKALGPDVWKSLTPPEQGLLNDKGYREQMVNDAKAHRTTGASAAEDAKLFNINNDAVRGLSKAFFDPGAAGVKFRQGLETNPEQALKDLGVWAALPADVQKFVTDPDMKEGRMMRIKAAAQAADEAVRTATPAQLANLQAFADSRTAKNFQTLVFMVGMPGQDSMDLVKKQIFELRDNPALAAHGGGAAS